MDKKTIKYALYVGLILFGLIGYTSRVDASVYSIGIYEKDTETDNSQEMGTAISGNRAKYGQQLGKGLEGTIATTTIYLGASNGAGSIQTAITLECYSDNSYTLAKFIAGCSDQWAGPLLVNTTSTITSISTVFTFENEYYYRLGIGCTNGCSGGTNPNMFVLGQKNDNPQHGNYFTDWTNTTSTDKTLGIRYMYFDITSDTAFGFSGSAIIDLVQATSTLPFNFPVLSACTNASTTTWGASIVNYTLCGLFQPHQTTLGYLNTANEQLKETFPFSVFFDISTKFKTGITSAGLASATSTNLVIDLGSGLGGGVVTINLIPAGGLWSSLISSEFEETFYNFILVLFGLEMIYLGWSLLLHHKN